MIEENEADIYRALYQDLSKPESEAFISEVQYFSFDYTNFMSLSTYIWPYIIEVLDVFFTMEFCINAICWNKGKGVRRKYNNIGKKL